MFDKHKDKQKYNNFGYHSTKFWLKGNDTYQLKFLATPLTSTVLVYIDTCICKIKY